MPINNLSPRDDGLLAYRAWLRGLVISLAPPYHSPSIFNIAWDILYVPTIPNDQNRSEDGINLRQEYGSVTGNGLPPVGPCRILEFLIGLAIRLNAADYDPTMPDRVGPWFWTLMDNLGIVDGDDPWIEDSLEKINTRDYSTDGHGGLFPLRRPKENQREVEIWYQMQAYLMENFG